MVVISSCFTFINTIFSTTAYVGSRLRKRKKLCREQALSCFIPTKILSNSNSNSNAQPKLTGASPLTKQINLIGEYCSTHTVSNSAKTHVQIKCEKHGNNGTAVVEPPDVLRTVRIAQFVYYLCSSRITDHHKAYVFHITQTTANLLEELAKSDIKILTSETFTDDPTAQVKSLKVSSHRRTRFISPLVTLACIWWLKWVESLELKVE